MALHKGGREVQLHFLGRGHTGGDTMVFLRRSGSSLQALLRRAPAARHVVPGDSFIDEWPASLERLKALDFDVIVPAMARRSASESRSRTFRTTCATSAPASALRAQGLTAEQATERMDMSKYAAQYGARVSRPDARAVLRAYELLQIQMPM